ncbi:DUF6457 domain-containing protein [Kitasatospora sp. A2-31]|uniref:DUF6457 domain-containing protein n=1 Tax=Kitasatospora sp. A2-31 TaxID=2916414 RepID=UPI0027E39785|nr:DUF6457 domain-containing protein [Kitasatospora sp. A2-31]
MKDWLDAVKAGLGVDLDIDVAGLLDMTKVVAHGVARPAAPLTAFLVGYAAAQTGGGPAAVAEANRKAAALAEQWTVEQRSAEPEPEPEPEPVAQAQAQAGTGTGQAGSGPV